MSDGPYDGSYGHTPDQVLTELLALRKGAGVWATRTGDRVGAALPELCRWDRAAPEASRARLADRIRVLAQDLPRELRIPVLVALALDPRARQPRLGERFDWLAAQLGVDARTVRRRTDDGLRRLAELACQELRGQPRAADDRWHLAALHATLRLDLDGPEVRERRLIVAGHGWAGLIESTVLLPRIPGPATAAELSAGPAPAVAVDVAYGGRLVAVERVSAVRIRYVVELPDTLRPGERHEYEQILRPDRVQNEFLILAPRRCDLVDLRVRFDRDRLPAAVWETAGELYQGPEPTPPLGTPTFVPDRFGEARTRFHDLRIGHGYGLRWFDDKA